MAISIPQFIVITNSDPTAFSTLLQQTVDGYVRTGDLVNVTYAPVANGGAVLYTALLTINTPE